MTTAPTHCIVSAADLLQLDARMFSARWDESATMNYYTLHFHSVESGEFLASFVSRTRRVQYENSACYLSRKQTSILIDALTLRGVILPPVNVNFRVGDPLPPAHPWKIERKPNAQPSYDYRAKQLERNRLDLRLREETRTRLNDLIKLSGQNATELIEQAVAQLHNRVFRSDDVLAELYSEAPALPAPALPEPGESS